MTKEQTPALQAKLNEALVKYGEEFKKVLPSHVSKDRFLRICSSEIVKNPKLLECTIPSFLGSIMISAQMGLEIGAHLGHAYLVPFGNQCQLQFGYKGMLELLRRSGIVSSISCENIYKNDTFEIDPLNNSVKFTPKLDGDRGEWYLTVAVAILKDGNKTIAWMTKDQILKRKATAKSKNIWDSWGEEMAKKTVLKYMCKLLPLSIEDQRLVVAEDITPKTLSYDVAQMIDTGDSVYLEEPKAEEEKKKSKAEELFNE